VLEFKNELIINYLVKRDMDFESFCRFCNINAQQLESVLENDWDSVCGVVIIKICKALDCSADEFLQKNNFNLSMC